MLFSGEPEPDSDTEAPSKSTSKTQSKPVDDNGDSDDSDSWPSDSESSSESSEDDDKYTSYRDRFLKKSGGGDEDDEEKQRKKEERRKERKDKDRRKAKRDEDDDGDEEGEWQKVERGVAIPSEKPKMFAKDAEIDLNLVVKKLSEIVAARGKKRTDRREQIELLHELQRVADEHQLGPAIAVKIKFAIISAIFDYNPKVSDAMKPEYWTK